MNHINHLIIGCDSVGGQTSAIKINVGQECITRWTDCSGIWGKKNDEIYVPSFPIARWIVTNWWSLLYEPCPDGYVFGERKKTSEKWTSAEFSWLKRHCLRCAESGLFLPHFCLWRNGDYLIAKSIADDEKYQSMPGKFVCESEEVVCPVQAEDMLRFFVSLTLRQIEGNQDDESEELKLNWKAIIDADDEELSFCRTAGKIGLDPYCVNDWPTGVEDSLIVPPNI